MIKSPRFPLKRNHNHLRSIKKFTQTFPVFFLFEIHYLSNFNVLLPSSYNRIFN